MNLETNNPDDFNNSRRIAFLGLIAWVSACLLIAGWGKLDQTMTRFWALAGVLGLISAVGLAETLRLRNVRQLKTLLSEATRDSLTGVGNRRQLDAEIDRRIAQLRRQGTVVSILLIDVDHFKSFNDDYGHQAGDAMLRHLAQLLVSTLRDMDLVTRYGGEEFAAVLPGTDLKHAMMAAERIRRAVEIAKIHFNETSMNTTISVGVTEAMMGDTPTSLLKRADAALYLAKNAGRNCSISSQSTLPEGSTPNGVSVECALA